MSALLEAAARQRDLLHGVGLHFTVLCSSTTFNATAPITTSPNPIVTQKSAISVGANSVSGGVVTLKLTTPFSVKVPIECEMVKAVQTAELRVLGGNIVDYHISGLTQAEICDVAEGAATAALSLVVWTEL